MTDAVSISKTAELAGVHRNTVRNWVKAGKLSTARLEGGQWLIDLDEIEGIVADRAAPTPEAAPAQIERALAPVMEDLLKLTERIAQAERERADAQRDQAIAEHEMARRATEAAELRQTVADLEGKQADLEEQLVQARRRWWRR